MFYTNITLSLFKKIRLRIEEKKNVIIMLGGIVSLLFLYLTTWAYNTCTYFAVLGTIIGFISSNKNIKTSRKL